MLFENMSRSVKKDFNHRPLKKRPVPVSIREETEDDNSEPENLSTKPEDLSRTGSLPLSPPAVAVSVSRRWPLEPPCYTPPHYPDHPMVFAHLPPHVPGHHLVAPLPSYRPAAYEQPWARCLPFPYGAGGPEPYEGLSPRAACSPPMRSPVSPKDPCSPVSVDSGISTESVPRRRREASAPRYQCSDCGKSYSTYSGLTKHRQFHCAAAEGNLAKKSFSCKHCPKVYTSLGALKMHIRTHTLPCKCHLCGKAFSRPWLLQGHIRTHTGEKPFSCHHCRRAFADRSNLRAHLQTHSEVKKYSCVSCSKTFSRMSLLSKHLEGGCPGCGGPNQHFEYRTEEMAY